MRVLLAVLVLALLALPVVASEPGEPLDCSDWEIFEPGLSCTAFAAPGEAPREFLLPDRNDFEGGPPVVTTEGDLLAIRYDSNNGVCIGEFEIRLFDGVNSRTLARIQDRQLPNRCDEVRPSVVAHGVSNRSALLLFDATNGRALIAVESRCVAQSSGCPSDYGGGLWYMSLEGFTTTFEILQSYEPTANEISFRVPYMPEGFQYADWFDTYYGDLHTVGDWSQAQPLQCGFPASAPSAGDYLTVEDTLPALELGQGRYYVTAVTHQGETRYGRKRSADGVLSGRDPAGLPGCGE